jgi:transglutaminase-like putative cysteine protease
MSLNRLSIIWVITSLFISMIPQLKSMPLHLLPITLLPIAWRLLAEFRGWQPMPGMKRVLATVFAVAALLGTYGGLMGRRAAVSMLVLMLALKLLETFRTRDARIVTSLSLFLCGTQFLFSQGVPMIIYIIACLLSSLIALMYLQRQEAWQDLGEAPDNGRKLFAELGFGLRLLAIALPIGLALFLFFPRWSSPLWGIPEDSLDARSGLSGSMSPGSIQSLFMDDSPAFRATFQGEIPSQGQMYWRGPVFWDFDGRRWQSGYLSQNLPADNKPDPTTAAFRYRVQMEPTEQRWLFALDYPALVPRASVLTMDYQLRARQPVTQLRDYLMASDPDFADSPKLRQTFRNKALELPPGFNPKTAELMAKWRSEANSASELVNRALAYFNREQFHYTLNPPLLSQHTVDEFLFSTKQGFCEHYASAFTVMMRMAGVPARIVTGYQGGWYNNIGSYVLVRQSDAHAWSEVWIAGKGWTRIDPTAAVAPSRVERGAMNSLAERRHVLDYEWLRNIRNSFDLFQRGWNNWVVAFGAVNQSRLFSIFGWEALDSTKLVMFMIGSILVISLIIFLLAPYLLKYRLRQNQDPLFRLWQKFIKKLNKAGLTVAPSMGPLELAENACERLTESDGDIIRISELYVLCRYSGHAGSQAELAELIHRFKPHTVLNKMSPKNRELRK